MPTTSSVSDAWSSAHPDAAPCLSAVTPDLINAAETMAARKITVERHIENGMSVTSTLCQECLRGGRSLAVAHAQSCNVAQVFQLVDLLRLITPIADSKSKSVSVARDRTKPAQSAECKYCGPGCLGGAMHFARAEDGAVYGSLPGEWPAAVKVSPVTESQATCGDRLFDPGLDRELVCTLFSGHASVHFDAHENIHWPLDGAE